GGGPPLRLAAAGAPGDRPGGRSGGPDRRPARRLPGARLLARRADPLRLGGQRGRHLPLPLAERERHPGGPHRPGRHRGGPAGLPWAPHGATPSVAGHVGAPVALVAPASGRGVERPPMEPFPSAVAVAADGAVYASAWGGTTVSVFTPAAAGRLAAAGRIAVG